MIVHTIIWSLVAVFWIVLFCYWLNRVDRRQRELSAENKQLRKDLYDLCCSHNKLCIDIAHLHGSAYRNR